MSTYKGMMATIRVVMIVATLSLARAVAMDCTRPLLVTTVAGRPCRQSTLAQSGTIPGISLLTGTLWRHGVN